MGSLTVTSLPAVEPRLVPLNAFIGLCTPDHLGPSPLADVGYALRGLEIPVSVGDERVVVDAVAFRNDANRLLAAEAKSGNNIEPQQARKYSDLNANDLVRATSVTIEREDPRSVQAVFVCLSNSEDRILLGLVGAGVDLPLLVVGDTKVWHEGAVFDDPDVQRAFSDEVEPFGEPPRYISVDPESDATEFEDIVRAEMVVAISHGHPQISIDTLAEQAVPYLSMYGQKARNGLARKIDLAARQVSEMDPDSFVYRPRTGTHSAVVEFLRRPEDAHLRGRTQMYQAISRAAGRRPSRRAELEGQERLFEEIISELDEASPAEDDDSEE